GVALVIEYTGPVLLLMYARLRGRSVGRRLWIAAALAVVGCFFAAGAYDARLRELNALGLALAAMDAFIFALYFAMGERLGKTYSTPTLLVWGFGFALVGWSVVHPPWLLPWTETTVDGYVQIAAVVVIATVIPFGDGLVPSGSLEANSNLAPLSTPQILKTSGEPFDIAIDAQTGRAYVTDLKDDTLFVFDVASGSVLGYVPTGRQPNHVVVS